MNKPTAILAAMALSLFCLGARCAAQVPIVHTVDFPKGDAAWNVTFEADPDLPTPPKPKVAVRQRTRVDIVRKGNLRYDIATWSDGGTTDYWWNNNPAFVLYQDGTDGRILVMKTGNMNDYQFDDSFFTWISAGTYKGMKTFKDKQCRYYQMQIPLPEGEVATLRAWIDNKTARPVGWSESGILTIFSFDVPLPPDPLVLPEKFQKELTRIQSFFVFPKRTSASGQH